MSELIILAKIEDLQAIVQQALDDNNSAKDIIDQGLIPGMDVVGERMKSGDMFIPEVLRSAKAMQTAMDVLRPHLSGEESAGVKGYVMAVKEHKPKILGMSALLTTTRLKMEETIIALKEANLRDQVKIMCGGAPVTKKFVEDIGGDGYGANAAAAVDKAKELVS
jgi:5-methyltetrahydrofolate--homocysteine methyltransferase